MTKHTLRAYQRNHSFEHPTEAEQGKIRRETNTYMKQRKAADRLAERLLEDPGDESLQDLLAASAQKGLKEYRNARVHKRRLKVLEREGLE